METRCERHELGMPDLIPPIPAPAPLPAKVPGPLPWLPRVPGSQPASALASCFWCGQVHPAKVALSVCPACTARYSTMRSLEMSGSYPLSGLAIDAALTQTSPGNYALGYMDGDAFQVFFVGRSDSDVRRRLHEWVGMPSAHEEYASSAKAPWGSRRGSGFSGIPALGRVGNADTRYTRFAYSYARTAEEAYAKEWRNYDAFGGGSGLDNRSHPVSAAG